MASCLGNLLEAAKWAEMAYECPFRLIDLGKVGRRNPPSKNGVVLLGKSEMVAGICWNQRCLCTTSPTDPGLTKVILLVSDPFYSDPCLEEEPRNTIAEMIDFEEYILFFKSSSPESRGHSPISSTG